jgi:serine/threonine-protein kinase
MGEVWQATDLVIGRTVAIKILKDEYLGDPGFLERFRAEARHAALVNHEGIANVFDYGEEEGSAFLVMELVPGEALSTILERERVLSTDRVLDIVAQTANALHAAHSAGLVHRDIKPGNLLITPDGKVKITDFGIARIADQVPLTATGQVMGTVQYLSPEQASGHPASPTTDIYSLGIVAYEALAGRRPFTGESQVAIAMAQINEAPPELPVTISEPVRNLVYSCIAKNPADRPASAAHLARASQALRRGDVAGAVSSVPAVVGNSSLAALAGPNYGNPTSATRMMPSTAALPTAAVAQTKPKRNPWTWWLIALIVVLLVVLAGIVIALVVPPDPDSAVAPTTSQSASPTPSPTPTEEAPVETEAPAEPTRVSITKGQFVDLTREEVEQQLAALNLGFDDQDGATAPSEGDVGKSYDVSPTGNLPVGQLVTVYFYTEIPTPPKPTTVTVEDASSEDGYIEGSTATVTWPAYNSCPAGFNFSGYNFSVSNGSTQGNPIGAGTTSLDITLGSPGETRITYYAVCGDLQSEVSDPAVISVVAEPAPEPTNTGNGNSNSNNNDNSGND